MNSGEIGLPRNTSNNDRNSLVLTVVYVKFSKQLSVKENDFKILFSNNVFFSLTCTIQWINYKYSSKTHLFNT